MPPTAVQCGLLILVSFILSHSIVEVEGTQWMEPVTLWMTIGRKVVIVLLLHDHFA